MKNGKRGSIYRSVNASAIGAVIEQMEPRFLQSVSTTTTLKPSAKSYAFGQTVDLTATVKAAKGNVAPKGTVQLYSGTTATGVIATLDKKGSAVFDLGPGRAVIWGKISLSARYTPKSGFTSSKSKVAAFTVALPIAKTTSSDGVGTAVITAGTGAVVAKGDTVTVTDTGYDNTGKLTVESFIHPGGVATFTVQSSPEQTIPGLDEAMVGTRVGETIVVIVPPALAYNDGKTLAFVMHVVSVKKP